MIVPGFPKVTSGTRRVNEQHDNDRFWEKSVLNPKNFGKGEGNLFIDFLIQPTVCKLNTALISNFSQSLYLENFD